jgi:hypothetical protein
MSVLLPVSLVAVYAAALIWRLFINTAIATFLDESVSAHGLGSLFAGALISTYLLLSWSGLYYGIYFYESVHRERLATARGRLGARSAAENVALPTESSLSLQYPERNLNARARPRQ